MNALELGDGIARRGLVIHGPDWSWIGHSEQAQYYALQVSMGDINRDGYANARMAFGDAQIASDDIEKAVAGSVSYWEVGEGYFVATNIGNGLCITTSPSVEHLHDFGQGLGVALLEDHYPGKYLGWSLRDGKRPRIRVDEATLEDF